jgi:hypothetical protein
MPPLATAIETYIKAKDENRPHMLSQAFAQRATVHMTVKTGAIAFPPVISGVKSIADALVSQFGRNYENVYTLCLSPPPEPGIADFSCPWLVGMSGKQDDKVRIGGGIYHWHMPGDRIDTLEIEIAVMQTLNSDTTPLVMSWLSRLPYPWCPLEDALRTAPDNDEVSDVLDQLEKLSSERS